MRRSGGCGGCSAGGDRGSSSDTRAAPGVRSSRQIRCAIVGSSGSGEAPQVIGSCRSAPWHRSGGPLRSARRGCGGCCRRRGRPRRRHGVQGCRRRRPGSRPPRPPARPGSISRQVLGERPHVRVAARAKLHRRPSATSAWSSGSAAGRVVEDLVEQHGRGLQRNPFCSARGVCGNTSRRQNLECRVSCRPSSCRGTRRAGGGASTTRATGPPVMSRASSSTSSRTILREVGHEVDPASRRSRPSRPDRGRTPPRRTRGSGRTGAPGRAVLVVEQDDPVEVDVQPLLPGSGVGVGAVAVGLAVAVRR